MGTKAVMHHNGMEYEQPCKEDFADLALQFEQEDEDEQKEGQEEGPGQARQERALLLSESGPEILVGSGPDSLEFHRPANLRDNRNLREQPVVPITAEQLQKCLPKRQHHNITPDLIEHLNDIVSDPDEREAFRDNFLSYTNVLKDPSATLPAYINAVKYISLKLMGYTNQECWIRTFPERYQRLINKEVSPEHIRAIVASYNKGKIVNQVLEQTLIPTYVLNQDLYQKALTVQAELMMNARSEKVRTDAANSLLSHLKQPETTKLTLDVNLKEDDSIRDLREATLELVRQQRLQLQAGNINALQVAESKIINGSFERVEGIDHGSQ